MDMNQQYISIKSEIIILRHLYHYQQLRMEPPTQIKLQAQKYSIEHYSRDFSIFHDTPQQRFARNKAELTNIINAVNKGQINPMILSFQIGNSFYPSYILKHHYFEFRALIQQLMALNETNKHHLSKIADGCSSFKLLGAIMDETINTKFRSMRSDIKLESGAIMMPENQYYYSFKTSLHINICCIVIDKGSQATYAFVKLRNDDGSLTSNIEVRDICPTVSPDYSHVGYRFNGVKPFHIIHCENSKIYQTISNDSALAQLRYSLDDLKKSIYITINYTSMRKQFKTIDESKDERPIIEYQGVSSRIIDGFASAFLFNFFIQKVADDQKMKDFLVSYIPYFHHIILERLIDLRECCGGFGYMQISGHPSLIERVCLRSGQEKPAFIPEIPQIFKKFHFFSNDLEEYSKQLKALNSDEIKSKDILSLYSIVCMNMRKQMKNHQQSAFTKQFWVQASHQISYYLFPFNQSEKYEVLRELLYHQSLSYILKHAKYIDWSFCKIPIENYIQKIYNLKNHKLKYLSQKLESMKGYLQITNGGNIVEGRPDSEQFYKQVFNAAKNNRRNSEQYQKYVKEPLAKLIKQQRAKL